MKPNPTKRSRKKVMWIILLLLVVFFAIQIPITMAVSSGKFARGNQPQYSVAQTAALPNSPLAGKTILFLGSSVTYGSAAEGESFVDYLVREDGITAVKEAVSGTTLVDEETMGKASYITRMKAMDTSLAADAFVCQLSTNDAGMKKPLGQISDSRSLDAFDTRTVAGAMEYIIVYARQTWDCPVIFYTGTRYKSEAYAQMVALLPQLQKKWDIGVIDLWNNAEMNAVSTAEYKLYMVNGIHPSRAGYRDWWLPVIQKYLYAVLAA